MSIVEILVFFSAVWKDSLLILMSFTAIFKSSKFLLATSAMSTAFDMNLPRDLITTSWEFSLLN